MQFIKNNDDNFSGLIDKELVAAIVQESNKERRRVLQEALYDRYVDKIFYKCLKLVKNREVAKDLSHDIIVKIFLKLQDYRGDSPFYGWVYAITYNYCISYLQREKKLVMEDFDAHSYDISADTIETEHQILKEMQLTQLEKLLDELNESERLILLMRYQDGMSVKEVAQHLSIGESAVKMRLKRSRDRLAELFKEVHHGN